MSNISLGFHGNRGAAVSTLPSPLWRRDRCYPIMNTQITKTVSHPSSSPRLSQCFFPVSLPPFFFFLLRAHHVLVSACFFLSPLTCMGLKRLTWGWSRYWGLTVMSKSRYIISSFELAKPWIFNREGKKLWLGIYWHFKFSFYKFRCVEILSRGLNFKYVLLHFPSMIIFNETNINPKKLRIRLQL